jgi:fibronectin-binding autotransporter adhesin
MHMSMRILAPLFAFAILNLLLGTPAHAGNTENYNGPSGSWGNAANWTPQVVPVSGDDVFVSFSVAGRTVTLDRDYTGGGLHLLQLAGNTLDLNGHTLRAQQFSDVGGGLIVGAGSALMAAGTAGAAGPDFDGSSGFLTFTGGILDLSGGGGVGIGGNGGNAGSLTLGATSSVNLAAGSGILLRGGAGSGAPSITAGAGGNGGSLRINTGAQFTLAGGTLDLRGGAGRVDGSGNNLTGGTAGTILLQGGTLTVSSAAIAGSGGNFAFTSGTLHLTDTSTFTVGNGSVVANSIGGSNVTLDTSRALLLDGDIAGSAQVAVSGGRLDLAGRSSGAAGHSVNLPNLSMTMGRIVANGANRTSGAGGAGNGGSLTAGGALVVAGLSRIDLHGGANLTGAGGGGGGAGGTINLNAGASLLLQQGGTIDLSGGATQGTSSFGGSGGKINVNSGARFRAEGGTVLLDNGVNGNNIKQIPSGGLNVMPGGTVEIASTTFGQIFPVGGLNFQGGTLHLIDTAPVTLSPFTLGTFGITLNTGDRLDSDAALTLGSIGQLTLAGGSLAARAKNLTIPSNASFAFNAGAIDLSGIPVADGSPPGNGGTLTLAVPITLDANRTLNLAGANAIGGAFGSPGGQGGNLVLNSGGQITLAAGTLAMNGGDALAISAAGAKGGNGGNVTINTGGVFTFQGGTLNLQAGQSRSAPLATNGSLTLSGGTLNVNTSAFNLMGGSFTYNSGTLHLTDTAPVTPTPTALRTAQTSLTFNAGDALISDASLTLGSALGVVLNGGALRAKGTPLAIPATAAFTFDSGAIDLSPPPTPDPGGAGGAGGTLTLSRAITLDGSRTITGVGGNGVVVGSAFSESGGRGGGIVLRGGGHLTLAPGGAVRLTGGRGSDADIGIVGGNGGAGGTVAINTGSQLSFAGGTLDLSGGAGGAGFSSFISEPGGAAGAAGAVELSGGALDVDTSAPGLSGDFHFNSGTLHVVDAAGFATGTSNLFNRALGGNAATLAAGKSLLVDNTFTVTSFTTFGRNGGSIQAGGIVIQSGATFTGDSNFTNVPVTNNGTFGGTLTSSGAGAPVNGGGTFDGLVLTSGGAVTFDTTGAQSVRSLTVGDGGKMSVTTGAVKVGDGAVAAPLAISGSGTVDLTTRGLIVDYAAANEASVLQTVRSNLVKGYNGGAWNGTGITSSSAAANSGRAVGYALARDVLGSSGGPFMGQTADGTSVLVRYTVAGDANLDGQVNFNDLVTLAQHYNTTDGSQSWSGGDFNYDGNVGFNDLVTLAQNYNAALTPAGAPMAADLPANVSADWELARASVPEPATLEVLVALVAFITSRRPGTMMRGLRATSNAPADT